MSFGREVPEKALEYVRMETVRLIVEAREFDCQYFKSYLGRLSTYSLTLYFWGAKGTKYSRRINVWPIFSRMGISYERWHAQAFQDQIDSTILATGIMHYPQGSNGSR
jgi:hypothetical protein